MVKIERTPTPPASLETESKKACGSYNLEDVVEQLKKDFHDKCYICELKGLTDIHVEHLLPHHNRKIKERVFDWNNLFYVCPHCNLIKNDPKYEEKVIDCCVADPEEVLCHIFADSEVEVRPIAGNNDEIVVMTADLIQSSFRKSNTGIRTVACSARFERLAETMNSLYITLDKFKENRTSTKYLAALRAKLKREYKFAAFTRYYVQNHLEDYPELKDYVC